MLPCVVIGDSIAVGVGQNRPDCTTVAQVGINSGRFVAQLLPRGRMDVDQAVISLGVNDGEGLDTLGNLRAVRSRVSARQVVWLLPNLKPQVREMIRVVAEENGDRLIDTRGEVGRDHLHPTSDGYRRIAAATDGWAGQAAGSDEPEEVAYAPSAADRTAARGHAHRHRTARAAGRPHHAGHGTARHEGTRGTPVRVVRAEGPHRPRHHSHRS